MRALYADPAVRALHLDRTRAGMARALASDPAYLERRRESGRRLNRDGVEARLGWCPPAYRELARELRKGKRLTAAEARGIVEAQIAADRAQGRFGPGEDAEAATAIRQASLTLGAACARLAARQQRESRA